MNSTHFSIARQFSMHPGPRFARQGADSGETLRHRLAELLARNPGGKIVIDLDGTTGIGSSFLDEAFGGLVRVDKHDKAELLKRFEFKSVLDPSYIADIIDSIEHADPAHA